MFRPWAGLLLVPSLCLAQSAPTATAATPLRLAGTVFGDTAEVEVRDLERARAQSALAAAWQLLSDSAAAAAQLEAPGAGAGVARPLAPEELRWLARTGAFCAWSDGAMSALGGSVHRLWGTSSPVGEIPTRARLEPAIDAARCERLRIDESARRFELAAGSTLDLRHFARGWAVDRAVEALRARGARNLWVRVGPVARAAGGGPDGRGWRFELPLFAGLEQPLRALRLIDQAVAVADSSAAPIRIAGERFSPYVDLRSGRPASGVSGVVVVTALAGDAQPLAAALFVFGANAGQMRLGVLRPKPAVLWLLGSSESGAPVLATSNWSAVKKQ